MRTTDHRDFNPQWAVAPGETLTELLSERDLSSEDLADLVCVPIEAIQRLLLGSLPMDIELASRISETLGGSVDFWMSREYDFRTDLERTYGTRVWLPMIPIAEMEKFGWLKLAGDSDKVSHLLEFFGVDDLREWFDHYSELIESVSWRKSPSFETSPGPTVAWLRQGELEAGEVETAPWNREALQQRLEPIRQLSRIKDPKRFLPQLRRMCAECGVAVVVTRPPKGCTVSGAARWISPRKALVQLSGRFKSDDHFWFTLFHEVGHLLLHQGLDGPFVDAEDLRNATESVEIEANQFSERTLIPAGRRSQMLRLKPIYKEVIRFAKSINVSPGVVVGQLQHEGKIGFHQLNKAKRRYEWSQWAKANREMR